MKPDGFKVIAPSLDTPGAESLEAEVERRAGPAPDAPIVHGAAEAESQVGARSLVDTLLRALAEDSDVAQGFPPQSHRAIGAAVVAAKKAFRLALQPLINDVFARQNAFNRRLLDTLAALHAENEALAKRVKELEGKE